MGDAFALQQPVSSARRAVIVGAGHIGVEMADALSRRDIAVTVVEQLGHVLPTVDPPLGALIRGHLTDHGVRVFTDTALTEIRTGPNGGLTVLGTGGLAADADVVLACVGVRPDSALGAAAGARVGERGAISVQPTLATSLLDVWAAGDCVETRHVLTGRRTYLPLGSTAHSAPDHKPYYPTAHNIRMRFTADRRDGRLLGCQLLGHRDAQIAKRIDIPAIAIHAGWAIDRLNDADLSYTPPFGSPWDALQGSAQAWTTTVAARATPVSGPPDARRRHCRRYRPAHNQTVC